MNRYVCIHGHFYQPPRENPWLEDIELQDSAYPFHDWNERITTECYEPNSAARILGEKKRISRIVNNYAGISFNLGPTLLSWLEKSRPATYRAVLEADRDSRERFSGHGSALAQAYNHMILPLANDRDRRTQVRWGIRDFEHRFGRKPEGMWLPEAAADAETLDILAELGVRFTLLAPHQAGVHLALARELSFLRAWNDAIAHARTARDLAPSDPAPARLLASLEAAAASRPTAAASSEMSGWEEPEVGEFLGNPVGGEWTHALPARLGRLLVILGGAFMLRALTESETVGLNVGVGLGLAYALAWTALAERTGRSGRKADATFYGLATTMIAFPLLIEATLRMKVFSSVSAASSMLWVSRGDRFAPQSHFVDLAEIVHLPRQQFHKQMRRAERQKISD